MNQDASPWAPHKIVVSEAPSVFPTHYYREKAHIFRLAMTRERADLLFRQVEAAEIANAAILKAMYPAPYVPQADEVEDR